MARILAVLALAMVVGGCSRPTLKQSLAECEVQAHREVGPVQDNDPAIADCMDGRGYEIRAGECSTMESPARVEGCYRLKSAR